MDSGDQTDFRYGDRIEIPSGHRLVADKGYDSTGLRDRIWDAGSYPCIPNLKNRKNPAMLAPGLLKAPPPCGEPLRTHQKSPPRGTHYEKLSLHFLPFVQPAAILDWLRPPL